MACPTEEDWMESVQAGLDQKQGFSLYIHLPFCENLCTYCGCHKYITKNHTYESPYVEAVLAEWESYRQLVSINNEYLAELHLGGGTPTFFSPLQLERLLSGILKDQKVASNASFSLEAHPNSTTREQLEVLYKYGFRRLSIGVQDYNPKILETINRKQSALQVQELTQMAREVGFTGINYDLLYGLPHQTRGDIDEMIRQVSIYKPDRIAFYGYAHIPWSRPSQRAYDESDLPQGLERWSLFEYGQERFLELGYEQIGMDHFALPSDELVVSQQLDQLHRNFMGYTVQKAPVLIGLGASAISETPDRFAQNEKNIKLYQSTVSNQVSALFRGHHLTIEDQILKRHITQLMCHYQTDFSNPQDYFPSLELSLDRLQNMQEEGLVVLTESSIQITELGKPFIRNICQMLDQRYWNRKTEVKFSKAL